MKSLFFDAGPIISLVMSRLAWILPKLKEQFGGKFYITPAVKFELVDRPLKIKRFEFEALEVMKLIRDGVLEVYTDVPTSEVKRLKDLANSSFRIRGKSMDVIQEGELQSVAIALKLGSAIVMDERTLRLFIENNREMVKLLKRRFHTKIESDINKMNQFSSELRGINIIRSVELASVAYKMGLLNSYIPKTKTGRNLLVDAFVWALKTNGCSVTNHEVEEIKSYLLK